MKFVSNLGNDKDVDAAIFAARVRYWRSLELAATDWTQLEDAPVDKEAWANYRQALRDLPSQIIDNEVELPVKPNA